MIWDTIKNYIFKDHKQFRRNIKWFVEKKKIKYQSKSRENNLAIVKIA